ncbi:MAG: hypothetical protein CMH30_03565 [Micavibrio sp.]|nr:hypothetical protein [Micavibrio sp.]
MVRSWISLIICILFGLLAASIIYYKINVLNYPVTPETTVNSWYIELQGTLERGHKSKDASTFRLTLPEENEGYSVVSIQKIANGFGEDKQNKGRELLLTKRNPDSRESIYARFLIYGLDANQGAAPATDKTDYLKTRYTVENRISNPSPETQALYDTIDFVIDRADSRSSTPLSFLKEVQAILSEDTQKAAFLMDQMKAKDLAALMVILARVEGYESRAANGILLADEVRNADILRWVEIRSNDDSDDVWRRFFTDPELQGKSLQIYRWWTGNSPLYEIKNFKEARLNILVKGNQDGAFTRALWQAEEKQPLIYKFTLQTLPLDQQLVLQVLLLFPIGALLVSFLRQVVGVKTIGTFMPVLIAVAFRETGVFYGILFFGSLIAVGMVVRANLDRLRLLMVPRLSAILTVTILFIAAFMVLSKDMHLQLGLSVALFPVVIITMFIERVSTMWDESGGKEAMTASCGSMLIACIIYFILINPFIKHFVFTFPEILFLVFGLSLVLGRYNGYKLSEYKRFWALKRAIEKQQKG